jgi:hypothetical protein
VEGLIHLAGHVSVAAIFMDSPGVMSGRNDETSPDMARVMGNLRLVAEEAEAGVVALHHQRKAMGTKVRVDETLRGHTLIEAALDLPLLVVREERSPLAPYENRRILVSGWDATEHMITQGRGGRALVNASEGHGDSRS